VSKIPKIRELVAHLALESEETLSRFRFLIVVSMFVSAGIVASLAGYITPWYVYSEYETY
jgi:hypothetical protein